MILLAPALALAQWTDIPTPGVQRLPDGKPDLSAPAPLFNRIKGYESSGFRVLGAPASLSSCPQMPWRW